MVRFHRRRSSRAVRLPRPAALHSGPQFDHESLMRPGTEKMCLGNIRIARPRFSWRVWATGGLIFGPSATDRQAKKRSRFACLYYVFTASPRSRGADGFRCYRFLTGPWRRGVGLAVALVRRRHAGSTAARARWACAGALRDRPSRRRRCQHRGGRTGPGQSVTPIRRGRPCSDRLR